MPAFDADGAERFAASGETREFARAEAAGVNGINAALDESRITAQFAALEEDAKLNCSEVTSTIDEYNSASSRRATVKVQCLRQFTSSAAASPAIAASSSAFACLPKQNSNAVVPDSYASDTSECEKCESDLSKHGSIAPAGRHRHSVDSIPQCEVPIAPLKSHCSPLLKLTSLLKSSANLHCSPFAISRISSWFLSRVGKVSAPQQQTSDAEITAAKVSPLGSRRRRRRRPLFPISSWLLREQWARQRQRLCLANVNHSSGYDTSRKSISSTFQEKSDLYGVSNDGSKGEAAASATTSVSEYQKALSAAQSVAYVNSALCCKAAKRSRMRLLLKQRSQKLAEESNSGLAEVQRPTQNYSLQKHQREFLEAERADSGSCLGGTCAANPHSCEVCVGEECERMAAESAVTGASSWQPCVNRVAGKSTTFSATTAAFKGFSRGRARSVGDSFLVKDAARNHDSPGSCPRCGSTASSTNSPVDSSNLNPTQSSSAKFCHHFDGTCRFAGGDRSFYDFCEEKHSNLPASDILVNDRILPPLSTAKAQVSASEPTSATGDLLETSVKLSQHDKVSYLSRRNSSPSTYRKYRDAVVPTPCSEKERHFARTSCSAFFKKTAARARISTDFFKNCRHEATDTPCLGAVFATCSLHRSEPLPGEESGHLGSASDVSEHGVLLHPATWSKESEKKSLHKSYPLLHQNTRVPAAAPVKQQQQQQRQQQPILRTQRQQQHTQQPQPQQQQEQQQQQQQQRQQQRDSHEECQRRVCGGSMTAVGQYSRYSLSPKAGKECRTYSSLDSERLSVPFVGKGCRGLPWEVKHRRILRRVFTEIYQQSQSRSLLPYRIYLRKWTSQICICWGLLLMLCGLAVFFLSQQSREIVVAYASGDKVATFTVEDDLSPPVYIYYRIEDYYGNYRSYIKDGPQSTSSSYKCIVVRSQAEALEMRTINGTLTLPWLLRDVLTGQPISPTEKYAYPCGLQSVAIYNDEFKLFEGSPQDAGHGSGPTTPKQQIFIDSSDIAYHWDFVHFIKPRSSWEKTESKPWILTSDPRFSVWLHPPFTPNFQKLYGVVYEKLGARKTYHFEFTESQWPAETWRAKKSLVLLSLAPVIGGANDYLAYCCMCAGGVCLLGVLSLWLLRYFNCFFLSWSVRHVGMCEVFEEAKKTPDSMNRGEPMTASWAPEQTCVGEAMKKSGKATATEKAAEGERSEPAAKALQRERLHEEVLSGGDSAAAREWVATYLSTPVPCVCPYHSSKPNSLCLAPQQRTREAGTEAPEAEATPAQLSKQAEILEQQDFLSSVKRAAVGGGAVETEQESLQEEAEPYGSDVVTEHSSGWKRNFAPDAAAADTPAKEGLTGEFRAGPENSKDFKSPQNMAPFSNLMHQALLRAGAEASAMATARAAGRGSAADAGDLLDEGGGVESEAELRDVGWRSEEEEDAAASAAAAADAIEANFPDTNRLQVGEEDGASDEDAHDVDLPRRTGTTVRWESNVAQSREASLKGAALTGVAAKTARKRNSPHHRFGLQTEVSILPRLFENEREGNSR